MSECHISLSVPPIYNEASATISTLVAILADALAEITDDYEIILVDDGSRNDAWELICAMSTENSSVKGIRLARNFGQHSAIAAGLDHTSGDWVVVYGFRFAGPSGGHSRTLSNR